MAGSFVVLAVATLGFTYAYARASITDRSRTIAERDKLFAHTLAQSIDVYVAGARRSVERLALTIGRGEFGAEAINPHVADFLAARTEFFAISVANLDGQVIGGLAPDATDEDSRFLRGISIAERDYFREIIATRKPAVSNAIISKVLPRPTIAVAAPVFNEKKELIGVVAAGLRLDELYNLAEYALGSEFATPVVIDGAGNVLVHPHEAYVAAGRNLSGYEPGKRVLRGEDGFLPSFVDLDGKERSAAYAPITGLDWGVWVAQDAAQFSELRRKVFGAVLPWATLGLLGMFALFGALMQLVYAPIKQLAEDARLIVDRGDLGATVAVRSRTRLREVEAFAESFNGLLGAVRKMRDDLQGANAAKSRFLTVATHAFRTPISVASWTLDTMVGDITSFSAEQREQILQLLDADRRIQLGFANLFASLELQGGTARADLQKGDLDDVLRRAVARIRPLAASRDVSIVHQPDGVSDSVFDEKKLGLVFDVVLSNAVFYSAKGGTVHVSVRREGDDAEIIVQDSGIGITEAELRQLFQPFFRGERAAKKFTDGTGLGLHIAKAYVELHGGTIAISSAEAKGTIVTLRIPLRPHVS